jgi:hypothetical protein
LVAVWPSGNESFQGAEEGITAIFNKKRVAMQAGQENLEIRNSSERTAPHDIKTKEFSGTALEIARLNQALNDTTVEVVVADLGEVELNDNLGIGIPDPKLFRDYRVFYPSTVVEALANLFKEYNAQFQSLADANSETDQSYRYNYQQGSTINHFVQIDMMGLPEPFLAHATDASVDAVEAVLRSRVFEIENSIAAYHLLGNIFNTETDTVSLFDHEFRKRLAELRDQYKKPIALLAVTQEKYDSMLSFEFGKNPGEELTNEEVMMKTGFDVFMGPKEFLDHLEQNQGESGYLLYVRASAPTERLKDPRIRVDNPLLSDARVRQVIQENSLTFNIDDPEGCFDRKINDTKAYLVPMQMAYKIDSFADLLHPDFIEYMNTKRATWEGYQGSTRLAPGFAHYLESRGVSISDVEDGTVMLRAKPEKEAYGCYGHARGSISNRKFKGEVRKGIERRGSYVVQPEMEMPSIKNTFDDTQFTYVDRNFFAMTDRGPVFMGGFRAMMSVDSREAKNGRIHGSPETIWAEILPADRFE